MPIYQGSYVPENLIGHMRELPFSNKKKKREGMLNKLDIWENLPIKL